MANRKRKHYKYFRRRVSKWRDYFGLFGWSILVRFEDIGPNRSAEIERYITGRHAAITLNKRGLIGNKNKREYELCKSAFHEIVHVILADLVDAAETGIGRERVEPMEERVVRILEQTVHGDLLRYWNLQTENEELKHAR